MTVVKEKEFVEISYSGYANGELFDSNRKEDLAKLDSKAEVQKMVIVVGEGMLVKGLDKQLVGKEVGKQYQIDLRPDESFGQRRKELVKMVPLSVFHQQRIDPQPGMMLTFDHSAAKIVSVSGARVLVDFNNPLAGKDIRYDIIITNIVNDTKEQVDCLFMHHLRMIPKYELGENITVNGPEFLKEIVVSLGNEFERLINKKINFVVEEQKKEEVKEQTNS